MNRQHERFHHRPKPPADGVEVLEDYTTREVVLTIGLQAHRFTSQEAKDIGILLRARALYLDDYERLRLQEKAEETRA